MSVTNGSLMALLEGGAREKKGPSHCTRKVTQVVSATKCSQRGPGKSTENGVFVESPHEPGVYYVIDVEDLEEGDTISGSKSAALARAYGWTVSKDGEVYIKPPPVGRKYVYKGKYSSAEEGRKKSKEAFASHRSKISKEAAFRQEHGYHKRPVYPVSRGARRAVGPSEDPHFYEHVFPGVEEAFEELGLEERPSRVVTTRASRGTEAPTVMQIPEVGEARAPRRRRPGVMPKMNIEGLGLVGGCNCCGSAIVGGYDGRSGPRTPAQHAAAELLAERTAMFRDAKVMDPSLTKREFFARFR